MINYINIRTKFNACNYFMKLEEIIIRKNNEDAQKFCEHKNDKTDEQNHKDFIALLIKGGKAKQNTYKHNRSLL